MGIGENTKTLPLVKVVFYLNKDDWHGYETESVWAEKISNNRCRIRNTPFYTKGVSFEDVVFVKDKEGTYYFESISIAGGHSTYRIIIDLELYKGVFSKYWTPLARMGCSYEENAQNKNVLLAIDVPSRADIYKVYSLLEHGESDNIWSFDEGHCGHPLSG